MTNRRPNRIGHRPVTATGRRCIVAGCPETPDKDVLICRKHSEALRPAPTNETGEAS